MSARVMTSTSVLVARQVSTFQPELLLLTDGDAREVGRIEVPPLPQARNARLRWHGDDVARGSVTLACFGQRSTIEFEYLTRAWASRVRFAVMREGVERASAEVEGRDVRLTSPTAMSLVRTHRFWRSRFALRGEDGALVGRVEEPRVFASTRELRAELPSTLAVEVQALLLFLASNQLRRQV